MVAPIFGTGKTFGMRQQAEYESILKRLNEMSILQRSNIFNLMMSQKERERKYGQYTHKKNLRLKEVAQTYSSKLKKEQIDAIKTNGFWDEFFTYGLPSLTGGYSYGKQFQQASKGYDDIYQSLYDAWMNYGTETQPSGGFIDTPINNEEPYGWIA